MTAKPCRKDGSVYFSGAKIAHVTLIEPKLDQALFVNRY